MAGIEPEEIPGSWKLGVCDFSNAEPLKNAATIKAIGFDYIEPGLAKTTRLSDKEATAAREQLASLGMPVLSMNWFLPPEIKITGPDVDDVKCRDYVEKAFALANSLGARAVVFGSPASRSIETDFPMQRAWDQLIQFCLMCADVIRDNAYSIRLGVEHVNHTETNVLNKLSDVIELVKQVNRTEVGVTVDFYHLVVEGEPMETILAAKGLVVAVQLADPATRSFPGKDDEIPQLPEFFKMLRSIDYQGGIGIEAFVEDVAGEGTSALACLRHVIAESA